MPFLIYSRNISDPWENLKLFAFNGWYPEFFPCISQFPLASCKGGLRIIIRRWFFHKVGRGNPIQLQGAEYGVQKGGNNLSVFRNPKFMGQCWLRSPALRLGLGMGKKAAIIFNNEPLTIWSWQVVKNLVRFQTNFCQNFTPPGSQKDCLPFCQ